MWSTLQRYHLVDTLSKKPFDGQVSLSCLYTQRAELRRLPWPDPIRLNLGENPLIYLEELLC